MRRIFDLIEKALVGLAVLGTLCMLVILGMQVVMRYAFNTPLSWSEEVAMLLFSWVIVFSTATGVRQLSHARMSLLVDVLPGWCRHWWERAISLLIGCTGLFITWAGWHYVAETLGSTSAAIGFPIEWLYACAPFFGVLLVLFSFERVISPDRKDHE